MPGATFVVPFGREGAADRSARSFARSFAPGAAIENVPGEGGLAGVRRANVLVREGVPTLLLGTPTTHVLLPARLGDSAGPDASLRPLASLGSAPNVLLVSPKLGVTDVDALVARARAGELSYASAGTGQTIHLCGAWFAHLAGIRMRHVPYDGGSATAYPDLLEGRVHVYFDNLLGARERIAAGEVRALAVSSAVRHPHLPQVPTMGECGFPSHALDVWLGVFGTASAGAGDPTSAEALGNEIEASRERWLAALRVALA